MKIGSVFRDKDNNGRVGIVVGKNKFVRLFGEFDCEYQRTQLLEVKMGVWRGNPPEAPLFYLGFIDGEDLKKAKGKEL